MITLADITAKQIGKAPTSIVKPVSLAVGTLQTRDLKRMQSFLTDLMGMECAQTGPGRMIARCRGDRAPKNYWVLEIQEAAEIAHPQHLFNHWGCEVATAEDVQRAHEVVTANQQKYGVSRVHPIKANHGSYSFYFEDLDRNSWEIECRPEAISYAAEVANGDVEKTRGVA